MARHFSRSDGAGLRATRQHQQETADGPVDAYFAGSLSARAARLSAGDGSFFRSMGEERTEWPRERARRHVLRAGKRKQVAQRTQMASLAHYFQQLLSWRQALACD